MAHSDGTMLDGWNHCSIAGNQGDEPDSHTDVGYRPHGTGPVRRTPLTADSPPQTNITWTGLRAFIDRGY